MMNQDAVTLIFSSRAEAARAAGLLDLKDIVDSAPFHRRITVKLEGVLGAFASLREDGFTDLKVEL